MHLSKNNYINAGKQQDWTWKAWQREKGWLLDYVEGVCAQSGKLIFWLYM